MSKPFFLFLILLVGCGTQVPTATNHQLTCHNDTDCLRAERCILDGAERSDERPSGYCGIPEQHLCQHDSECAPEEYCQLSFSGEDAGIATRPATTGVCTARPLPRTCRSNRDCTSTEHCAFAPIVVDAGSPQVDAGSPQVDAGSPQVDSGIADDQPPPSAEDAGRPYHTSEPTQLGVCVPNPLPTECDYDQQCGEGYRCVYSAYDGGAQDAGIIIGEDGGQYDGGIDYDAGPQEDAEIVDGGIAMEDVGPGYDGGIVVEQDGGPAPAGEDAGAAATEPSPWSGGGCIDLRPRPRGVCVMVTPPPPPPSVCYDDSTCAAGEYCNFAFGLGAEPPGREPSFRRVGVCIPEPIEPTFCRDARDCIAGETCARGPYTTDHRSSPTELGICVSTYCNAEQSCPTGSRCDVACLPCPQDASCPACRSICVPDDGNIGFEI